MVKLVLEKAEEPEIKLATSTGSLKQESSIKTSIFVLLTMPKPLTVYHNKLWKILKEMGISDQLPASSEISMQVKKQHRTGHGTMDWFQTGKGVYQVCILLPFLFKLYAEYIM